MNLVIIDVYTITILNNNITAYYELVFKLYTTFNGFSTELEFTDTIPIFIE